MKKPHYNLWELKKLLRNPRTRHITRTARQTAVSVGFASASDIINAVMELSREDFDRTLESTAIPCTYQDVYKKNIKGVNLYIKLNEHPEGNGVVISFKRDTGKGK
jgi:pantoate kinase